MIIQNYPKLSKDGLKKIVLQILETGLAAAMPQKPLKKIIKRNKIIIGKKIIRLSKYENVYVVAFGKAADLMTMVVNSLTSIKGGFIVIPQSSKSVIKNAKFRIFQSGHPIPNQASMRAAKTILKFIQTRKKNEFVIFLVSGGASSLLSLPQGITLKDKIQITTQLLPSGLTIQELNCVRKHLSKIKGGALIKDMQCDGISLVMSDVMGDDLFSIASGTTYYDNTKFEDALKIIKKHGLQLKIPTRVLDRLQAGSLGKLTENPRKSKIKNHIILSNCNCLKAMTKKANQLGFSTQSVSISGDVKDAARKLASLVPKRKNSCLIFGGETTVRVTGMGKGGRNQELVLRILNKIQKTKQNLIVASIGTDGIDGNTKYAGAIAENVFIKPDEIKLYLKKNDSSSFFRKHGGRIKTGYTHTNLMDIGLIVN